MSDASPHVLAQLERLREAARLGPVVDLACGRGRNALALAERGLPVLGVDRDAEHLAALRGAARERRLPVAALRADLEAAPWPPLAPGRCGALVVCRYLHRPLAPRLAERLRPGGWLVYETFTIHQRDLRDYRLDSGLGSGYRMGHGRLLLRFLSLFRPALFVEVIR